MTPVRQFLVPVVASLGAVLTLLGSPGTSGAVVATVALLLVLLWLAAAQSWVDHLLRAQLAARRAEHETDREESNE